MKPILVDFDTDRLLKLELMKSTTEEARNALIRKAVDFYFDHGDWHTNNTYREHEQGRDERRR